MGDGAWAVSSSYPGPLGLQSLYGLHGLGSLGFHVIWPCSTGAELHGLGHIDSLRRLNGFVWPTSH